MSEFIVLHGIAQSDRRNRPDRSPEATHGGGSHSHDEMTTLIMALTTAMWAKNFGGHIDAEVCAKIADAPALFEFSLPFFVEVPDSPVL